MKRPVWKSLGKSRCIEKMGLGMFHFGVRRVDTHMHIMLVLLFESEDPVASFNDNVLSGIGFVLVR